MADDKRIPLGPVSRHLMGAIRREREERGLTYKDMSARLSELGRPIPPLGLSRIEHGDRRVDLDDLLAISRALGDVSPLLLMFPVGREHTTDLPGMTVPTWDAVKWFAGLVYAHSLDLHRADDDEKLLNEPLWLYRRHEVSVETIGSHRRLVGILAERGDADSPEAQIAHEAYERSMTALVECRDTIRRRGLLLPPLDDDLAHLDSREEARGHERADAEAAEPR